MRPGCHGERIAGQGVPDRTPLITDLARVMHTRLRWKRKPASQALPAAATGAHAVGSMLLGAIAIGAVAVGALAIGRLAIGRARIGRLEIDELVVRRLDIVEKLRTPDSRDGKS